MQYRRDRDPANVTVARRAVVHFAVDPDLVAMIQTPTQGLQYRGKLLKKLPASVLGVLDDDSRRDISAAADIQQLVVPTDWVLTGQATVRVPIRQE